MLGFLSFIMGLLLGLIIGFMAGVYCANADKEKNAK